VQLFVIRLEAVQLVFTSLGAIMGAIGLMILFVGVLATGATRVKFYKNLGARVGGRISCVIVSELSSSKLFSINRNRLLCHILPINLKINFCSKMREGIYFVV